jgi:hypothetical protein
VYVLDARVVKVGETPIARARDTLLALTPQDETQWLAMLVGQPIGEKPNSYQESRRMTLPNSHLVVGYSVRFYKFVESGENAIRPDQEIIPSRADYKAGRDPVLEWVLKYEAK